MKNYLYLLLFGLLTLSFVNCSDDPVDEEIPGGVDPDPTPVNVEVQDFIWSGMNIFYLWQENVNDLADDRFADEQEYVTYLSQEEDPVRFFESLIYNRTSVDFWSWIVDDYIDLENSFAGIFKSNGVDFGLVRFSGSDDIFGYVRYIMPNSDASDKNIQRGDLFTEVNGTQLNIDNYRSLLFGENDTYTLTLAEIQDGTVVQTGESVELTKFEYTENPILVSKVLEEGGQRIGYLMYNGFTRGFDDELNEAFLQFKNEGVTDLVLDFRYNPGGSVSTAVALASMVTGQYEGEVFSKEQWNSKIQAELERAHPDWLVNNFSSELSNGNAINSLGLNSVHIIATGRSASASELVIKGLEPYVDVTLVGERTSGKYTASITLYDSENFTREDVNPNHTYAMQPIVLASVNSVEENAKDGIAPDITIEEDLANLGVLGDRNEPLLDAAISDMLGVAAKARDVKVLPYETITDTKMQLPMKDNMFVERKELREFFKRAHGDKK